MTWKPATLREKCYNMIWGSADLPKHGHWFEYMLDSVAILMNLFFVVGCYCFQSTNVNVYIFGDYLFIAASLVNTVMAGKEMVESLYHKSLKDPEQRDEVLEAACFFLSSALFMIGCVFFLPTLGSSFTIAAIGAWCCILGSFGLVYGVFYTALGFAGDHIAPKCDAATAQSCRQLVKIQINLNLIGTVLFTVGSFMYRPIFGGQCPPHSTDAVCSAVSAYGTKAYLYGSYCFLVGSFCTLACTFLKSQGSKEEFSQLHYKPISTFQEPTERTKLVSGA